VKDMCSHIKTDVQQNITEAFFMPEEKMPPTEVYLPFSMQFDYNKSYEYSTLSEQLKYKVIVNVDSTRGNLLHYENTLPKIAGKPFVLDFVPATTQDAEKMQNPSIPAYEINVKPQLYLDTTPANGTNVVYGSELDLTLNISLADSMATTKFLYAGEKSAIVIDAPKTEFLAYNRTFERAKQFQNSTNNESFARESLFLIGQNFFSSSNFYTDGQADSFGLRWARTTPAIAFVVKNRKAESFGNIPVSVKNSGSSVDLKFDQIVTSADKTTATVFNLQRGIAVSGYEGAVLEMFYSNVTGISATKILNDAVAQNTSLYFISNDTIERLDYISIPQGDKEIIRTLLQQSPNYFVIIPQTTAQITNWSGIGYIIIDGKTGAGRYLISGGLAGGNTDKETDLIEIGKKAYCTYEAVGDFVLLASAVFTTLMFTACSYTALVPGVGEATCGAAAFGLGVRITATWVVKEAVGAFVCQ